jgi:hypothetical protein
MKKFKPSFGRAQLLIVMAFLLLSNLVYAQTPTLIGEYVYSTKGQGAAGAPNFNYNIPSGKNRVMIVTAYFERDHIALGQNYPGTSANDVPQLLVGTQNISRYYYNYRFYGFTNNIPSYAYMSTSIFSYRMSDLQNLPTGNTSFSFPSIASKPPQSAGDDVIITVSVFENASQSVPASTLIGNNSDAPSSSTTFSTLTSTAPVAPVGTSQANIVYIAHGAISQQSALNNSTGWIDINTETTNNALGQSYAGFPDDYGFRPNNEADGASMKTVYRSGVSGNPTINFSRPTSTKIMSYQGRITPVLPLARPSISGTVFNDTNGPATIQGTGTNAGGVYVNIIDINNNLVYSAAVASNGTYTIPTGLAVESNQYRMEISSNTGTAGNPAPLKMLPSGWETVGESSTGTSPYTSDGTNDGIINLTIGNTNLPEMRFGITTCAAGTTAPTVNSNLTNVCPATTVNLTTAQTSTAPSGTQIVWYTNNVHSGAPLTATQVANAGAGTYYAFYQSTSNASCYSAASNPVSVTINSCVICNAGTAESNQTIAYSTAPTALTLTGSSGDIQWQVSTDNITFANVASGGTATSYSPGILTATRYYRAVVTSGSCTSTSNVLTITVNAPTFDCIGKIYSLAGATGEIRAFTDPATSGALGTVVNTTPYPQTPASSANGANAMGYSNLTKKFYYVQIQATGSGNNTFVSYDPATNLYETLAGTTGTIYRGTVTNDGAGYYAITNGNVLKYYSIANNTWTIITSTYVDQNGVSLNSLLNSYAGGDIAMDGNGDLWILAGQGASPTAYVFRAKSTVPTTSMGSTPLVLEQIVKQDIGSSPNGIAFSPTGQLYITNVTTLFRMNDDFTISAIGAISPAGGGGDLASCAFPVNPFAVSDFGDAPDTYKTILASDGPRHMPSQYDATTKTASLMIGSTIDLEIDGIPNANANGDDLSNINDENSISITTLYINSSSYTTLVPVVNNTGGNATLRGWIDFNKNGIFDSSESATVTVPNGATSASLTWTGLSGLTAGDTYYRLRIAKNAADITLPTGSVFGGEVEDGKLTIQAVCYEDPTLASGQTYPVKHGITLLGRSGKISTGTTNTASDWPMVRNSAYTALESKTKGFVITRNSNPEASIAIPVVGMMVFDTDENAGAGCLKIYTGAGAGEGWKCFNTQGCPPITH